MDNVCHTLVGAALAQAGLKRRTALGAATLMIGANFPDIDVLAVPFGHGVDFRRGWTHGVLALAVLPFVLTAIMLAWEGLVAAPTARRARNEQRRPTVPRELLLLSAISILTHPALDWMNEYGMRWLMPFSGRWFYGDTLFIVDPWLWVALALGVVIARRAGTRPARAALAVSATYVVAMLALSAATRRIAERALAVQGLEPVSRMMVSASFANPLRRRVILDEGSRYHYGTLSLGPSSRLVLTRVIETQASTAEAIAAAETAEGRRFLVWSRFPFYVIERRTEGILVRIADARYSLGRRGGDWAAVEVLLPPIDPPTADTPPTPLTALEPGHAARSLSLEEASPSGAVGIAMDRAS
ncbi:MAG: metal-dependent hydrolase [Gemmatimonadaceae bacterium]